MDDDDQLYFEDMMEPRDKPMPDVTTLADVPMGGRFKWCGREFKRVSLSGPPPVKVHDLVGGTVEWGGDMLLVADMGTGRCFAASPHLRVTMVENGT